MEGHCLDGQIHRLLPLALARRLRSSLNTVHLLRVPAELSPLCTGVFVGDLLVGSLCHGVGEAQRAGMRGGSETEKYVPLQLFPVLISSEWFLEHSLSGQVLTPSSGRRGSRVHP